NRSPAMSGRHSQRKPRNLKSMATPRRSSPHSQRSQATSRLRRTSDYLLHMRRRPQIVAGLKFLLYAIILFTVLVIVLDGGSSVTILRSAALACLRAPLPHGRPGHAPQNESDPADENGQDDYREDHAGLRVLVCEVVQAGAEE